MMKKIIKIVLAVCCLTFLFNVMMAGCEREGPMEKAGKKIDKTVDKAGKIVEETGEKMQE